MRRTAFAAVQVSDEESLPLRRGFLAALGMTCTMLFPSEERAEAGADLLDQEDRSDDRVRAAPDVARDLMGVILRHAGIGRCDVEQPLHQIDQTRQRDQNEQARGNDGDDDPYRGDRRPARNVAALVEGRDIDQHDQRHDDERGQHDGQDDLPCRLPAMPEIGFVNGLGEFGFHRFYFSIRPPPSRPQNPKKKSKFIMVSTSDLGRRRRRRG